ncbi:thioredoxin domain-containing protein [Yoonia sp.]|nr:thioredoxin domain-containing protein [Yoonia sp.]
MTDAAKLTCLSCGQANRVPLAKLQAGPKCAKCATPLADGNVATLDATIHDKATLSDTFPLIIDYWAAWCGPCKMMAPAFAQAAQDLQFAARFAKIDTEQFPAVSQRLQIRGIPLLILYMNGREAARLSGARPAADIAAFVRSHL